MSAEAVEWAERNHHLIPRAIDGGNRVAVREALVKAFDAGRVHEAWEPPTRPSETIPKPGEKVRDDSDFDDLLADAPDSASELRGWWEQTAHDEVAGLTAKMIEYGGLHRATDLAEIGRGLVHSGVKIGTDRFVPQDGLEREYQELGCYFYLLGKFARWTAAVAEGRPVSDDTLLDIGIYVRMVQRIRHTGGWPV